LGLWVQRQLGRVHGDAPAIVMSEPDSTIVWLWKLLSVYLLARGAAIFLAWRRVVAARRSFRGEINTVEDARGGRVHEEGNQICSHGDITANGHWDGIRIHITAGIVVDVRDG
jgi:hypothetical protein